MTGCITSGVDSIERLNDFNIQALNVFARNILELLITDAAQEYLDGREHPVALDYLIGLG